MITASIFVAAGLVLLFFPSRRRRHVRIGAKNQGIWVERKPQAAGEAQAA